MPVLCRGYTTILEGWENCVLLNVLMLFPTPRTSCVQVYFFEKFLELFWKFYCLWQGTSKRGRKPANHSGRQASSQSGSQSGKQAGTQADRNTQFGFLSVANYDYKHWGTRDVQEHSVVEWPNTRRSNPGRRDRPTPTQPIGP